MADRKSGPVLVTPNLSDDIVKAFEDHEKKEDERFKRVESATSKQTWILSIISAILTGLGTIIHAIIGH